MKLNISEIKNKCEKDDKVNFPGKVKVVFPVNVLSEEKITKYAKARQNVIIKDDTGEIKVIVTFKELGNDYDKSMEGKEVEVSGKVSIYNNEKNIFGFLKFKEGEAPVSKTTTVVEKPKGTSAIPIVIEVRKASLKLAIEFWTARIGEKMEEGKIIKTADIFYLYLTGKADKVTVQKKETVREEEEKAEVKKEGEDIKKEEEMSERKVKLINEVMASKESHKIDIEVFKGYCNGKEVKALTIEELEKIKKILDETTEEIPF